MGCLARVIRRGVEVCEAFGFCFFCLRFGRRIKSESLDFSEASEHLSGSSNGLATSFLSSLFKLINRMYLWSIVTPIVPVISTQALLGSSSPMREALLGGSSSMRGALLGGSLSWGELCWVVH